MPNVPVHCPSFLVGEGRDVGACRGFLSYGRWGKVDRCVEIAAARDQGAVKSDVIIAAEAAYAVRETGNEAKGGTWLWPVFDADGEVGLWSRNGCRWHGEVLCWL